jgi:hypothetical protein
MLESLDIKLQNKKTEHVDGALLPCRTPSMRQSSPPETPRLAAVIISA